MVSAIAVMLGCFFAAAQTESQGARETRADNRAELTSMLARAKRIYVESFGDDRISKTLQAMLVDSFTSTKRFIITENRDRADLILKGSALEKTSQELHALGSGTTVVAGSGHENSNGSGSFSARGSGIEDAQTSTETINDARIAVRLVSPDGDVVWSTTQESKGAKYKGAIADCADKVAKQLLRDIEKASAPQEKNELCGAASRWRLSPTYVSKGRQSVIYLTWPG